MAKDSESCEGCPGYGQVSLDSMPPYVYCTSCKKPVLCKVCGAPTGGDCYPPHVPPKEPDSARDTECEPMSDPLNDALPVTAQFVDASQLTADKPSANMQVALDKGWIEKRGANYYVVEAHREELDAAYPGDAIYAS